MNPNISNEHGKHDSDLMFKRSVTMQFNLIVGLPHALHLRVCLRLFTHE